jgi:hypothetical protein
MNGYTNGMWNIDTMEYYSVLEQNKILMPAPTWINFENITVSERSQIQKHKYCMIPLI